MFKGKKTHILTARVAYVLLLGAALLPLVVKKELKELKIASVLLFVAISAFILIFSFEMLIDGNFENHDESYDKYFVLDGDLNFIKGLSMLIVAQSFQMNLFPMYNSLEV